MGFLTICSGVVLLQLSKSAKDVPDSKVFAGDMDQVRTIAEQEEPVSEPKADAIRGGAGFIRALSVSRRKQEAEEAKRIYEERMEPVGENEVVEWDGLRRRKTLVSEEPGIFSRRKTLHPPLGLTYFPEEEPLHLLQSKRTTASSISVGARRVHLPGRIVEWAPTHCAPATNRFLLL